jgi:hypothetical protein
MSITDAPDWQAIVNTVPTTGAVVDSPDWQTTVVTEGGVPVMTNPMTTKGDIIVGGTSGTPARLAIGTGTQFLGITGGTPAWKATGAGGTSFPGPFSPAQTFGKGLMTVDPAAVTSSAALTVSQVYVAACVAMNASNIAGFEFYVSSAGTGTANECYTGIYSFSSGTLSPGTLLASTAAGVADGSFGSVGFQVPLWSTSVNLVVGTMYYLAILYNGTACSLAAAVPTVPNILRLGSTSAVFAAYGSTGGGYTTLPANWTTTTTNTASALHFFFI